MQTHYPDYDVMNEAPAWDDHTREIVKKRLEPAGYPKQLSPSEAELVTLVAATLIDDERKELLGYILKHIDQSMQSPIGESDRKVGLPPRATLIHKGLTALEASAQSQFQTSFAKLDIKQRQSLLGGIERAEMQDLIPWRGLPQPEFFKTLLNLVVEAYYSHPTVWSEIGYGGPAYPRGYVRTELNLTDPWEADKSVKGKG